MASSTSRIVSVFIVEKGINDMCGIAGIVSGRDSEWLYPEIQRMVKALQHRGPDGHGSFVRDGVALGHSRLSIIDIEGGGQPMHNEDESVWVVYNGEIYNADLLRARLEKRGHIFNSRCDTEIIVHAYEEWGSQCASLFRGMFAFAVINFNTNRGLLARDHAGIKPLYYRRGATWFAFASEIPALRDIRGEVPIARLDAIDEFLRFGYISSKETIYSDVFRLMPGSFVEFDLTSQLSSEIKFWDMSFPGKGNIAGEALEANAFSVIHEAVASHLVADVPVGVFLSGGIDSTLIALMCRDVSDAPVQAFNVSFREPDYSELEWAQIAANELGIHLHTSILDESILDSLPALLRHYGEPFGDSSCLPTYAVSRDAKTRVSVILSGDGGDEAFGGYSRYADWLCSDRWRGAGYAIRARDWKAIIPHLFRGYKALKYGKLPTRHRDWLRQCAHFDDEIRAKIWRDDIYRPDANLDQQPAFSLSNIETALLSRLSFAQYQDFHSFLPGDILTKVDIASMFHGLEVRVPLLDKHVLQFAGSLNGNDRIRIVNGGKEMITKVLLKQLLRKRFNKEFVDRYKKGFEIPRRHWLTNGSSGRNVIREIRDRYDLLSKLFRLPVIEAEIQRHSPVLDSSTRVWYILCLALWLEHNEGILFS
jgi:asparagine synthase (glutamine-hydrolysing)